jgi:hypothetical protein
MEATISREQPTERLPAFSSRLRLSDRPRSNPWVEGLLVVAFYAFVAAIVMFPALHHPTKLVYGFGNDNLGGMRLAHGVFESFWHGVDLSRQLEYPFHYVVPNQGIQPVERLWFILLGGPGNGALVQNAQLYAGFVLSGCTMYLLARYVTRNRLAALVAGAIFAFSPFHLAMAMQYTGLAAMQWIPLFVLSLLVLLRNWRTRDAVLCGLAFAVLLLNSYYYAWLTGWFTALVLSVLAVRHLVRRRRADGLVEPLRVEVWLVVRRAATAVVAMLVVSLPLIMSSAQAAGDTDVAHPLNEAIRYSARPWMFVVPPLDNPLWGSRTANYVQQHLFEAPVYEQSIYIGLVVAILALAAVWRWGPTGPTSERAARSRLFFGAGALIAFVLMLGPYIPLDGSYYPNWADTSGIAKIPSLPLLIFKLGPMFRFFSRSFVLLSTCLAVLAAIGLTRVFRRFGRTAAARVVITCLVLIAIAFEFANQPPRVVINLREPAWVAAERALPSGAPIVDYPIASVNSPRSLYYTFWQSAVAHPTANPFEKPEAAAFAGQIKDPDLPATGKALHNAGIRYAVIHTKLPPSTSPPYQPQLPDDSMPATAGASNPWFEKVGQTSDAVIYRIRPPQGTN